MLTSTAKEYRCIHTCIFFTNLKADVDVIANKNIAVVCLSFYIDRLKEIFKDLFYFPISLVNLH